MGVADLLKEDGSARIEDEGRRVGSLMRCVPAQSVLVRHLIVRINNQLDVRRKIGLLRKELLGVLIKIGWWTRINEQDVRLPGCEVRTVLHEVMHLLDAVRALISRKAAEQDQYRRALGALFGESHRGAGWRLEGEVGRLRSDGGGLRGSRSNRGDGE